MITLGQLGTRNLWANPEQIAAGGLDFATEPIVNCVMRADGKRITALDISEWVCLAGRCIVRKDVLEQPAASREEAIAQGKIFIDVRRSQLHADPEMIDRNFFESLRRTGIAIPYPAPHFAGGAKMPYRAGSDEIFVRTDRFGPVDLGNIASLPATGVETVSLSGKLKVIRPSEMHRYDVIGPCTLAKKDPTGPNVLVIPAYPETLVVLSERDIGTRFFEFASFPSTFYHHA